MSKIEVNAIEPQSGTTLTLGASGDTVTLAAGASQSGFGRTGTVDWSSTIRTSGFTAVSGVGYFCDTSSAAFTVTLPASPSTGDIVAIKDWSSTAATNNIGIGRNSQKIEGNTTDGRIDVHGDAQTLVFSGASRGWMVVGSGLLEGIQAPQFIAATGGTVLTCGNFKTHVFTGPGSFVVSCGGNDLGSNSVEYVVVAGGAGGGGMTFDTSGGGGGGAGGFRQNYPSPTIAGLPVTATTYPITVGGGGAGGSGGPLSPSQRGVSGSNSIFSTITSAGGGGGGGVEPIVNAGSGGNGGSGGGGGSWSGGTNTGGSGNTPPVSPSQGNNGGSAATANPTYGSAGGGGAGAAGTNGTPTVGGPGGVGANLTNPFFGPTAPSYGTPGPVADTRYFAGGGGGSTYQGGTSGTGGVGGGGAGGYKAGFPSPNTGPTIGVDGTANTGGGGGGNSQNIGGKAGGSGIVVIRYKYQ
jgi:hypothetical protein